jgi:hypothetical protein
MDARMRTPAKPGVFLRRRRTGLARSKAKSPLKAGIFRPPTPFARQVPPRGSPSAFPNSVNARGDFARKPRNHTA